MLWAGEGLSWILFGLTMEKAGHVLAWQLSVLVMFWAGHGLAMGLADHVQGYRVLGSPSA
jgi:hypothetical protein